MRAMLGLRCSSACLMIAASLHCSRLLTGCMLPPRTTYWTFWTCCSPICWHAWESQEKRRRLSTIGDLDAAALLLRDVGLLCFESAKPKHNLRREIFKQFSREQLEHAVTTVGELARPPENKQAPEALLSRYSLVRQFLPPLLQTITPHDADGGRAVLAVWEFLRRIERMATPLGKGLRPLKSPS